MPRTGTKSLSRALEVLLGGTCHHMVEVMARPEHIPLWRAAPDGTDVDWDVLLGGYDAAVDWPASAHWRELSARHPEALVVLSVRSSAREWWDSFDGVIRQIQKGYSPQTRAAWNRHFREMKSMRPTDQYLSWVRPMLAGREPEALRDLRSMLGEYQHRFLTEEDDAEAMMAAYERHNAEVREAVPADRLLELRPEDGWGPLADALGVAVPAGRYPRL
ncbi:sulfotransferase family protein [Nocardiopsis dassonvillei]|uniref:sulfotransferase family protein n=1 Tax=Nocardiopsis dassonvillei TaxID=2014 RepID=UPI003F5481C0